MYSYFYIIYRTKFPCDLEKLILEISNNPPKQLSEQIETIIDFVIGDIETVKLKTEAAIITDFVKSVTVIDTYQMGIK